MKLSVWFDCCRQTAVNFIDTFDIRFCHLLRSFSKWKFRSFRQVHYRRSNRISIIFRFGGDDKEQRNDHNSHLISRIFQFASLLAKWPKITRPRKNRSLSKRYRYCLKVIRVFLACHLIPSWRWMFFGVFFSLSLFPSPSAWQAKSDRDRGKRA